MPTKIISRVGACPPCPPTAGAHELYIVIILYSSVLCIRCIILCQYFVHKIICSKLYMLATDYMGNYTNIHDGLTKVVKASAC